jgi:hypothetical protein
MAILDLDEILKDARAAAAESGKEWEYESDNSGFQIYGAIENPDLSEVSRRVCKQPEHIPVNVCSGSRSEALSDSDQYLDATAQHITNLSPKNAIALVRRIQIAEEKLQKIEKSITKKQNKKREAKRSHKLNGSGSKSSEKILGIIDARHNSSLVNLKDAA